MFKSVRNLTTLTLLMACTIAIGTDTQDSREHSVRQTAPNVASATATTQYRLPMLNHADAVRKSRDSASRKLSAKINEAYFVSVDLFLDGDFDADGHYYVIDLSWDADTAFPLFDVYAVMWLSFEGGPWEEFLTTDVYTLAGDSTEDSYRVESELQRGYPTGYYDVLLELYDPVTGQLLAEIGPADTTALEQIPLEDSGRDTLIVDHDHGGSGSLELYSIIAALGLVYYRRRRWGRRAAKL